MSPKCALIIYKSCQARWFRALGKTTCIEPLLCLFLFCFQSLKQVLMYSIGMEVSRWCVNLHFWVNSSFKARARSWLWLFGPYDSWEHIKVWFTECLKIMDSLCLCTQILQITFQHIFRNCFCTGLDSQMQHNYTQEMVLRETLVN